MSAEVIEHLPWVGVDLGTSWARAAAWTAGGEPMAQARAPMPPVIKGMQDPLQVRHAGEAAIQCLGLAGPVHLALTTQRDTLLRIDQDGEPVSSLLSWRVRHHLEDPERRLREQPQAREGSRVSLEEWILRSWRRGWSWHGSHGSMPQLVSLVLVGGDKNTEYLALGLCPEEPQIAGLSLGSAIALGVAFPWCPTRPDLPPGVVASEGRAQPVEHLGGVPGGVHPVWHLETGILSGMGGLEQLFRTLGLPPWEGPLPHGDGAGLRCIPHFGGALDDLDAHPQLFFTEAHRAADLWATSEKERGREGVNLLERSPSDSAHPMPSPQALAEAWAQGVVDELQRLRPRLEAVTGRPIQQVRVTGGGTLAGSWADRLARTLGVSVVLYPDPWMGCRGAVMAAGGPVGVAEGRV